MIGRRIFYSVMVLAALLYYIFHTGYFAWLVLVLVLAFFPLQLLMSIPLWRSCRVALHVNTGEVEEGEDVRVQPVVLQKGQVCAVKLKLLGENRFTGETQKKKMTLKPRAKKEAGLTWEAPACGVIRFSVYRPRMLDIAGLVALPLRRPEDAAVLVRPVPHVLPEVPPPAVVRQSSAQQQAPGRPGPAGMREFTDIREYREGDPLRDVHWKLSAKLDKMIVREASIPSGTSINLGFDFFGDPALVSRSIAMVEAVSDALWEVERPHRILWQQTGNKPVQERYIETKAEFHDVLWLLLSTPLPAEGEPMEHYLPAVAGPLFLARPDVVELYEDGVLKEVVV